MTTIGKHTAGARLLPMFGGKTVALHFAESVSATSAKTRCFEIERTAENIALVNAYAAAPELLDALEDIASTIHPNVGGTQGAIRKIAIAALSKAKGGEA